ncbi:MAG: biotin/lipoyl-binding protein [Chloroflexota bacterium]|nr:biotin/lipoyl-binding protein [Chloroflexota bacterium]
MAVAGRSSIPRGLVGSWPGRLLILAVVALVAATAVVSGRFSTTAPTAELRTAPVTRSSVTQTVAVSGSVNAAGQVRLNFKSAGRLAEVYVNVGSQVIAGQALARLDLTDLQNALAQAQANLIAAQAKYDQATAGAAPEDIAIAQQAVAHARRSLDETQKTTQNDLAAAQQTLQKVKTNYQAATANFANFAWGARQDVASYQSALGGPLSQIAAALNELSVMSQTTDVKAAALSLNQAQAALTNAASNSGGVLSSALTDYAAAQATLVAVTDAFDAAVSNGEDTSGMSVAFQTAQAAYTAAATRLSSAVDAVATQLAAAQAAVTSAQNSLNTVASRADLGLDQVRTELGALQLKLTGQQQLSAAIKSKITQGGSALTPIADTVSGTYVATQQSVAATQEKGASSIMSAQNSVESAQASLAKTAAPPKSSDITSAYASLLAQQTAVDAAQSNIDNATLRAPIPGLVAQVNAQPGESVASGGVANPFILIANTTSMALHGTVGEADVAKMTLGQVATVTVDAVGTDARMTGKVTGLDPIATIQQGVPVYGIDVTIDVPAKNVRPGMTGTANVILASKQGVLTVPNLAIRSGSGRRFVQVLRDGQAEDTDVTFGISNDTATEVTAGLQDGDQVVLPQPRAGASAGTGGRGVTIPGAGGGAGGAGAGR